MDRYRSTAHFSDYKVGSDRSIAHEKPLIRSYRSSLKRSIAPKKKQWFFQH